MRYEVHGEITQTATLYPESGETFWAGAGSLVAWDDHIDWSMKVPGGLGGAFKRSLAGEGVGLTFVEPKAPEQEVILGSNAPGHLFAWDLATQGTIITTRGSFLAAWGPDIEITVTTAKKAGAAFFGGAGLFLQKISGMGTVLIHARGDILHRQLAPGETLRVSTGNLAAFAEEVDYSIQTVGTIGKTLFGGEGLFVTRLRGPGACILQTLKPIVATAPSS